MFHAELGNPAKRFLKRCDPQLYGRMMAEIRALEANPFPSGVKRVVGREEKVFRVRVGDYRILYVVFHEQNSILIADIDKRSKVYD